MSITAAEALGQREADFDEQSLHRRVQWFVDKWTNQLDLNRRDASELNADLLMVVQAVHKDASRETHALLTKALMAMPAPSIILKKESPGENR